MNPFKKASMWLLSKAYSLSDYSTFERAFSDWLINVKGDKMVGWVASCANVWGTYFAKTKFRIYKQTAKGLIEQTDHPFLKILRKPNEYQTWWEQKYLIALFWILYGKVFFLKLRRKDTNAVTSLVMLKPWLVDIISSDTKYIDHFEYRTDTEVIKLSPQDVIHLKVPTANSFTEGRAIIESIVDQQIVDKLQTAYQKKFYERGGFAGRTFVAKKEMGKASFDRVKAELEQNYGGSENAFKVALLEMVEPVKAAYSIKDMDIANQRILTRDEILGALQVPKILLGIGESINRATAETAVYQFASGVVDPYMDYIDDVFTIHLQMDYKNDKLECIHDTVAPKDTEQAIKSYEGMFRIGGLTINEIREEENRPKFDTPLCDLPLINVGGSLVDVTNERLIGIQETNPAMPTDKPDKEDDSKSLSLSSDATWKQFARRHDRLSQQFNVAMKQFMVEQKNRLLKSVAKANFDDFSNFYLSESELLALKQFLETHYLRMIEEGFRMGANTHNIPMSFFNPKNDFVQGVVNATNAQALGINQTTLKDIQRFLGENISDLSNAELSRIIKMKYEDIASVRVPRIVNTSITAGLNAGLLHSFEAAGLTKKIWITERDARVRMRADFDHVHAEGQEVLIKQPFTVSGEQLMFPADPLASAGNAVNCRCSMMGKK